jgi:hypothetical protein
MKMKRYDPSKAVEIFDLPINLEFDGYCDYCKKDIHTDEKWRIFSNDFGLYIFHEQCYDILLEKCRNGDQILLG